MDSLLYQCLNTLIKICLETQVLTDKKWADVVDDILGKFNID